MAYYREGQPGLNTDRDFHHHAFASNGILPGANNVAITGGTFISHVQNSSEDGFEKLQQAIAFAAIHNSAERESAPNCHPGTREEILQQVSDWIADPNTPNNILWLSGKAGVGKTAVMQELANTHSLNPSGDGFNGNVVASFFFAKGRDRCNNSRYLFPTIAYQLALNMPPAMRTQINQVMQHDPFLTTRNMKEQLNNLIISPLRQVEHISHTATVIIDGLDECGNPDEQESIIFLIASAIRLNLLPLRFIIASRPESHICEAFDDPEISQTIFPLTLHGSYEDVEKYLRDRFDGICSRRSRLMQGVAKPWPTDDEIQTLVRKSSGHFIYASTVIKFVEAKQKLPAAQLNIILSIQSSPSRTEAFTELDSLYTQILELHSDQDLLYHFLQIMVIQSKGHLMGWPPDRIKDLLGIEMDELTILFESLASLIDLDPKFGFTHASILDYLLDPSRSGSFHVAEMACYDRAIDDTLSKLSEAMLRGLSLSSSTWDDYEFDSMSWLRRCARKTHLKAIQTLQYNLENFLHAEHWEPSTWHCHLNGLYTTLGFTRKHLFGQPKEKYHYTEDWPPEVQAEILQKYEQLSEAYSEILDRSHRTILSLIDIGKLLDSIPGVFERRPSTIRDLSELYNITEEDVVNLLSKGFPIVQLWPQDDSSDGPTEAFIHQEAYDFICDRDRAGRFYRNPIAMKISFCESTINFIFRPHTVKVNAYHCKRFDLHIAYTLQKIFGNPPGPEDDELIQRFLEYLLGLSYCQLHWSKFSSFELHLVWETIKAILSALWDLKNPFYTRLKNAIVNKIFSEILCSRNSESGPVIALQPLFSKIEDSSYLAIMDIWIHFEDRYNAMDAIFQEICQELLYYSEEKQATRIHDFLLFLDPHRLPFHEFITDKDFAGDFYIAPEIYFTRHVEICLHVWMTHDRGKKQLGKLIEQQFYRSARWVIFLPKAAPTEKILTALDSIDPEVFALEAQEILVSYWYDDPPEKCFPPVLLWLEALLPPRPSLCDRWREAVRKFEERKRLTAGDTVNEKADPVPDPSAGDEKEDGSDAESFFSFEGDG